jgi:hypothetical protein
MAGTGFFAIMLLRPEWPIIGNFVLKFSRSGFGNSLTHSNRRRSNARWEHFSNENENEARSRRLPGGFTAYNKPCVVLYPNHPLTLGPLFYTALERDNEFAVFLGDEVFGATA